MATIAQPIKRETIKTASGYRTYGAFTAVLDTDADGKATYSNMAETSDEYRRMMNNNRKFRRAQ